MSNIRRQTLENLRKGSSNIKVGETKTAEEFLTSLSSSQLTNNATSADAISAAKNPDNFLGELTGLFAERKLDLYSKSIPAGEYNDGTNKNNVEIGKLDRCSDSYRFIRYITHCDNKVKVLRRLFTGLFGAKGSAAIFAASAAENKNNKYERIVLTDVIAGIDMVVVNEVIEKAIKNKVFSCNMLNPENINAFLEDMDVIFRFYIETGIDSSKKMYKLWMSLYHSYIRPNLGLDVKFYGNLKNNTPFAASLKGKSAPSDIIGAIAEKTPGKKYLYNDPANFYRMTVAKMIAERCNSTLPTIYSNCKYVYDTMIVTDANGDENVVEVKYDTTCKNYKLHKDMYSFLARYREAIGEFMEKDNTLKEMRANWEISTEEYDSTKKAIAAKFDADVLSIESELLALCKFAGLSDLEIGKTLVLVSYLVNGGKALNPEADNMFALTILPEYVNKYLMSEYGAEASYADEIPVGYKLETYAKNLPITLSHNDVVWFDKGVSLENNVRLVKSNYTGELTVYENFEIQLDSVVIADGVVDESKLVYKKVLYAVEYTNLPAYNPTCESIEVSCKLDPSSYELLNRADEVAIKSRPTKNGSSFLALTATVDYVEYYIGSIFCNSEERRNMLLGTVGVILDVSDYGLYTRVDISYGDKLSFEELSINDELFANRAGASDNTITDEDIDNYDLSIDRISTSVSDSQVEEFMAQMDSDLVQPELGF